MSKDEPVSLIAVAKAAGVSKTTASDAPRDSGRVPERTKQHVVAVVRRLG
ncbi:LacI family DNA-binding transcriptional regulator [Amycolatopsis sp. NPDC006125]